MQYTQILLQFKYFLLNVTTHGKLIRSLKLPFILVRWHKVTFARKVLLAAIILSVATAGFTSLRYIKGKVFPLQA
jgi:hypothetical protein